MQPRGVMALPTCPRCGAALQDRTETCPSCGAALAAAPVGGARGRKTLVVIAVAVVVVIAAAAGLLLYLNSSQTPSGTPPSSPPSLALSSATAVGDRSVLTVSTARYPRPATDYRVALGVGSMMGPSMAMAATQGTMMPLTAGGAFYGVVWGDQNGTGTVDVGDTFTVYVMTSPMMCMDTGSAGRSMSMVLNLSRADGSASAARSFNWACPQKPMVTFASGTVQAGNVSVTVAAVSQALTPYRYRINLAINGTLGTAANMPNASGTAGSVSVPGFGDPFSVTWSDIGAEGTVNSGDLFRIAAPLGMPVGVTVTLYILWMDGSQIVLVNVPT